MAEGEDARGKAKKSCFLQHVYYFLPHWVANDKRQYHRVYQTGLHVHNRSPACGCKRCARKIVAQKEHTAVAVEKPYFENSEHQVKYALER